MNSSSTTIVDPRTAEDKQTVFHLLWDANYLQYECRTLLLNLDYNDVVELPLSCLLAVDIILLIIQNSRAGSTAPDVYAVTLSTAI
jgi:hypothetical protein